MILANINLGSGPSAGDGDPLRTAFAIINNNFSQITSNVNALTNSVTSVAGRTGNVTLTSQDIAGFSGTSLINSSAPDSNSSSGVKGQIIVTGGFMYVCVSTNTWVRSAVETSF